MGGKSHMFICLPPAAELSKHKRYEIRMSVYNAVGEGPTSTPQEVFVGEAGVCVRFLLHHSYIIFMHDWIQRNVPFMRV